VNTEYSSVLRANNPANYSALATVVTGKRIVAPAVADTLHIALITVLQQVLNRCFANLLSVLPCVCVYVFLVSVFTSFHLLICKFIITCFLNFFRPFLPSFLSLLSILSLPYLHMSWHSLLLICHFYSFIYFCFDNLRLFLSLFGNILNLCEYKSNSCANCVHVLIMDG